MLTIVAKFQYTNMKGKKKKKRYPRKVQWSQNANFYMQTITLSN